MLVTAYFDITPAQWDTVLAVDKYTYNNAVSGYLNSQTAGHEIYEVIADESLITAIASHLGLSSSPMQWNAKWGYDRFDPDDGSYLVDPATVLSWQKDIIEYDEDQNPIGSTPPTYENPNWGHAFAGVATKVFGGIHDDTFDETFF